MATSDIHAEGSELDDEALRGLTEVELARLVAVLQADSSCKELGDASGEDNARSLDDDEDKLGISASLSAPFPVDPSSASSAPLGGHLPGGWAEDDVPPGAAERSEPLVRTASPAALAGLVVLATVCIAVLLMLVLKADDPCEKQLEQRCGSLQWRLEAAEHERNALRKELERAVVDRERLNSEVILLRAKSGGVCGQGQAQSDTDGAEIGQQLRIGSPGGPPPPRELAGTVDPLPAELLACEPCPLVAACEPCPPPAAVAPCPAPMCKACPMPEAPAHAVCEACPTVVQAPAIARDEEEQKECKHRLKLYQLENDRLRLEPEKLQEEFHRQSQEIWRLRGEVKDAKGLDQKSVHEDDDEDSWFQRAKVESAQLRADLTACRVDLEKVKHSAQLQTDLNVCQVDLDKARKVQEQMLKLVSP